MAKYTDEQEILFGQSRLTRNITVNGTVTISTWDGTEYLQDDVLTSATENHSFEIRTQNLKLKLTPEPGTSYTIEEGEQR